MLYLYLLVKSWLQREEGQDLAEYAILLALIALIVVVAVYLVGQNISGVFSAIGSATTGWF